MPIGVPVRPEEKKFCQPPKGFKKPFSKRTRLPSTQRVLLAYSVPFLTIPAGGVMFIKAIHTSCLPIGQVFPFINTFKGIIHLQILQVLMVFL